MSHIKCNHCNQFTELSSEYLTFCSHCGKKLQNNFSDWKRQNAGKTFDDFKNTFGTDNIENAVPKKVKNYNPAAMYFFVGLGILLFSCLCYLTVISIQNLLLLSNISHAISHNTPTAGATAPTDEWTTQSLGKMGYTKLTPYQFNELQIPLPPEVQTMMNALECYQVMDKEGMMVFIVNMETVDAIYLDENTMTEFMNRFSSIFINSDVGKMEKKTFMQSKKEGMLLHGDVEIGQSKCKLIVHTLFENHKAWSSFYIIPSDKKDLEIVAHRMFQSVEINDGDGMMQ
jgi:hypothetical protein